MIHSERDDGLGKRKRGEQKLDTVADAVEYCRSLIQVQLDRAADERVPMNEATHGDAHTRKAITTLLPDHSIRKLFLETTRNPNSMPRVRTLFGAPPYNFLWPEDAGLVRAAGIASGRVHMAYARVKETASYSQFAVPHLVDGYDREYRIVTVEDLRDTDDLPCNLENATQTKPIYLNVRVPKRSKQDRVALLNDATRRRSLLFPAVGEIITVNYSTGLQSVWGTNAKKQLETKLIVKSMVPRSASGATAAVVATRAL